MSSYFCTLHHLFTVIPSQELPVEITEAVYKRVFTEMPIRVLAFDAHGNHIQLLERSAIANQILSRISAAHSSMAIQTTLADGLALAQDLSRYAILSHTWIRATPGDVVFGRWAARTHPRLREGALEDRSLLRGRRARARAGLRVDGHGVHQQGQQQRARRVDPLDVPLVQPRSCLHHVPVANAEYRADARGFVVHPWMDTAGATRPSKHTVLQ